MARTPRIRPPRHRLDRRFILWRTLQTFLWGAGVLGALGAAYRFIEVARPWLGPVLLIAGVLYLVNLVVMPTARYLVHRWETTDDAVYALEGWLTRKWQIIPVSRIQSIDTEIGPLQQLLRLATVKVTTAAQEGTITIEGLDARTAEETVDRLRAVTADGSAGPDPERGQHGQDAAPAVPAAGGPHRIGAGRFVLRSGRLGSGTRGATPPAIGDHRRAGRDDRAGRSRDRPGPAAAGLAAAERREPVGAGLRRRPAVRPVLVPAPVRRRSARCGPRPAAVGIAGRLLEHRPRPGRRVPDQRRRATLLRHPRGALVRRLGWAAYGPALGSSVLLLFVLSGALPGWVWPLPLALAGERYYEAPDAGVQQALSLIAATTPLLAARILEAGNVPE